MAAEVVVVGSCMTDLVSASPAAATPRSSQAAIASSMGKHNRGGIQA